MARIRCFPRRIPPPDAPPPDAPPPDASLVYPVRSDDLVAAPAAAPVVATETKYVGTFGSFTSFQSFDDKKKERGAPPVKKERDPPAQHVTFTRSDTAYDLSGGFSLGPTVTVSRRGGETRLTMSHYMGAIETHMHVGLNP